MATRSSTALRHWNRIIQQWPADKLRPDVVSFPTIMQSRVQKHLSPSANSAANSVRGNEANIQPAEPPQWNENKEMKQANLLYVLLENRFAREYPLPSSMRHPASDPMHYDKVVDESEQAPSRGFLTKLTNKLKGMIRFS